MPGLSSPSALAWTRRASLLLLLLVAVVGCGGGATTAAPAVAPTLAAIGQPIDDSALAVTPAARPRPTATRPPAPTATKVPPARPQTMDGLKVVSPNDLPPEGRKTLSLIQKGGPFPYTRDGITFENREGRLPRKASGYYREYTVDTPGSPDRGARRIITGQNGEIYYTDNHYDTFVRVIP